MQGKALAMGDDVNEFQRQFAEFHVGRNHPSYIDGRAKYRAKIAEIAVKARRKKVDHPQPRTIGAKKESIVLQIVDRAKLLADRDGQISVLRFTDHFAALQVYRDNDSQWHTMTRLRETDQQNDREFVRNMAVMAMVNDVLAMMTDLPD